MKHSFPFFSTGRFQGYLFSPTRHSKDTWLVGNAMNVGFEGSKQHPSASLASLVGS